MQIGALWLRETSNGKKYMSGNIQYPGTDLQFAVFKNEEKKEENHPDYFIAWSPEKKSGNNKNSQEDKNNGAPF